MLDVHRPIECNFTKRIVNIPWEASILLQLILGTWTIHVKGTRYNKCQTFYHSNNNKNPHNLSSKLKVKSYDNGKVAPWGLSLCMWKIGRQTMYFDDFTNSLEHIFGSLLYNNMMNSTMFIFNISNEVPLCSKNLCHRTLVAILFTTSFRFKFANFNRCGYNYNSVPVTISCDNIFSSWK